MYKFYRVRARMESYGAHACISLGVNSFPSTETLKFLLVKNELISFIKFVENCNLYNLCNKPGYHVVSTAFFDIQEYRSCGHNVVKVKGHVIRKPHTLKCRAVTRTKAKLTCIWQVFFNQVPMDCFLITSSNSLPVVDNRLIGLKFCGNFGSLPGLGNVITFASFKWMENMRTENSG
jgi:hypothetical protein